MDATNGPSRQSVKATYETIGSHFAETRDAPWPAVESFLEERPPGALGLDCGCGNGRHLPALAGCVDRILAVDITSTLLSEACERASVAFDPVRAEASALPMSTNSVDTAIYIATVHHLPTRSARVDSISELARVLAPEGRALVSAWSVTHERFDVDMGHDRGVEWTLPEGKTVERFYHIYDPAEFERDLRDSGATLDDVFTESGNCYGVIGGHEG